MNLKAPANGEASQVISVGKASWFFPANDSVDLAALPVNPDVNVFDFETVPFGMLSDEKADALSEGDEVLFTGLFIQYMGQTKIEPIVRSGSIAMLPDESIPTTLKKPGNVYLTEVHAFGGNSGSPVFVDIGGLRRGKFSSFKLLGVVAGEVFETNDFHLQVSTTYDGKVSANSGISMIVPASDLKALLESEPLQKMRDDVVNKEKSAH
jgi:hypothetical protein